MKDNVNIHVLPVPSSPDEYRGELIKLGWKSTRNWSLAHGYIPRTTDTVLDRWAARTTELPRGGTAKEIMRALRYTITHKVRAPKKPKTANVRRFDEANG